MRRRRLIQLSILTLAGVLLVGIASAQRGWQRVRSIEFDRRGVPTWEVDERFEGDLFTFVRIRYDSYGRGGGGWATDYPDSDLNFSLRLQQLTSLNVNPNPIILD